MPSSTPAKPPTNGWTTWAAATPATTATPNWSPSSARPAAWSPPSGSRASTPPEAPLHQRGIDPDLAGQQLVGRAGVGNLQQPFALRIVEIALQRHPPLDVVARLRLAVRIERQLH